LNDRRDDCVADRDIRSFSARFSERKHARGPAAEINERLITTYRRDDAFHDLSRTERAKVAAVEKLFHGLGFVLGGPYPLIDGHTRLGAHNVPSV
jgi:hypothetical protein